MFKFYVLEVLLVILLFSSAIAKPYGDVPELLPGKNLPTIKKVLGNGVKRARVLENVYFSWADMGDEVFSMKTTFKAPFSWFKNRGTLRHRITKIVVILEKTNEQQTANVKVLSGGINFRKVKLQISVKHAHRFNYRVVVYGPPEI